MALQQRFVGISPITAQSIQGDYATISAAGSGQSTATAFKNAYVNVTGGTGGIILAAGGVGDSQGVFNSSGSAITVYPPSGSKINQFSANTGVSLANNTYCEYFTVSGTQIFAQQSS